VLYRCACDKVIDCPSLARRGTRENVTHGYVVVVVAAAAAIVGGDGGAVVGHGRRTSRDRRTARVTSSRRGNGTADAVRIDLMIGGGVVEREDHACRDRRARASVILLLLLYYYLLHASRRVNGLRGTRPERANTAVQ